ncbi:MAG: hypothetical protein LBU96_14760 [Yokenella regensburgei]|jgi:hypothetical protein|nr:hypothetical protein [Yokenella regensburgei]MDR3105692.1 hypothetical protein [Yokenella regensburgei]
MTIQNSKPVLKPVLLNHELMDEIRRVQKEQAVIGRLGVMPSVNSIARALVEKGLEAMEREKQGGAQ